MRAPRGVHDRGHACMRHSTSAQTALQTALQQADLKGADIALPRGPAGFSDCETDRDHDISCVDALRLSFEWFVLQLFVRGLIDLLKNFLVHPSLYCSEF